MGVPKNPLHRFSDRVENYVKFRPTYPPDFFEVLKSKYGMLAHHVVVDVGSGTGISTRPFLENGNAVYSVEPNAEMREAAEKLLSGFPGFHCVAGQAEFIPISEGIADFILAAQAFHWFDPERTRAEFVRISKTSGYVVLVWNDREIGGSEFAHAYEELVSKFGLDYKLVKHKNFTI